MPSWLFQLISFFSQYNKLAQSTADLLKHPPIAYAAEKSAPVGSISRSSVASLPPLDMSALEGVAVRDSESSFLISPLPQFTNALPSVLGGMAPLPELTEDVDGEEKEEEEEISTPDSARHERPIESHREYNQERSRETIASERSDHFKGMQMAELSLAAPYHRARSRSIPSHSTSSSSPRSASASPPKPILHDLTKAQTDRASSSYLRDAYTPSIRNSNPDIRDAYPSSSRNSNPDGDALRIRLHDLLRDSPTSSSLPNMPSSYFSSSFNKVDRDSSASNTNNSPPLPNAGGTSGKTHNSSDGFSHLLASAPQSSNRLAPAPSPSPFVGQRYSSASTEAKKLEEERRRKHLEEKQQRREERYKAERHREDRAREERHREGQKDERHGVDNERPNPIADREHPARAPPTTSSRWDQPVSSSQNYIYAAPNSVSPLKRGSSAAGHAYSQQSGVPSISVPEHVSGQHARYAPTTSGGHKSRPVPIPGTNSGHTYP